MKKYEKEAKRVKKWKKTMAKKKKVTELVIEYRKGEVEEDAGYHPLGNFF